MRRSANDVREAIGHIRSETAGVTIDAFEADWRKRWPVERGGEIISEATRHLTDELKCRHPEIPWAKAAGIRKSLARGSTVDNSEQDVIVVGAGNAAASAALSARECGASVLMLEVAPKDQRGGNSAFTGGAFRVVYHGGEDLARLIPDNRWNRSGSASGVGLRAALLGTEQVGYMRA